MTAADDRLSVEKLGFDPDALATRYAQEREKRIRQDAEAQFVQLSHDSPFANKYLEEDPYMPDCGGGAGVVVVTMPPPFLFAS